MNRLLSRRNRGGRIARLRRSVPVPPQLKATAQLVADRLPGVSDQPKPRVSRQTKLLAVLGVVTLVGGYLVSRRHNRTADWSFGDQDNDQSTRGGHATDEPQVATDKPSAVDAAAAGIGDAPKATEGDPQQ